MKATIKTIATICVIGAAGFGVVGFSNHGDPENIDSIIVTTTVTFENISLTNSFDVIVDGEFVGQIGPRKRFEFEVITGSHSIVYRNADSGEIASGDRTVTVGENEHLTVYCSYDG